MIFKHKTKPPPPTPKMKGFPSFDFSGVILYMPEMNSAEKHCES